MDMPEPDAALLNKQMDRYRILSEAVSKLVEQTGTKRSLLDSRSPTRVPSKRLIGLTAVVAKTHRSFQRRTKRAAMIMQKPLVDGSLAAELVELAIRQGERTRTALERYDAVLDELLTAV